MQAEYFRTWKLEVKLPCWEYTQGFITWQKTAFRPILASWLCTWIGNPGKSDHARFSANTIAVLHFATWRKRSLSTTYRCWKAALQIQNLSKQSKNDFYHVLFNFVLSSVKSNSPLKFSRPFTLRHVKETPKNLTLSFSSCQPTYFAISFSNPPSLTVESGKFHQLRSFVCKRMQISSPTIESVVLLDKKPLIFCSHLQSPKHNDDLKLKFLRNEYFVIYLLPKFRTQEPSFW